MICRSVLSRPPARIVLALVLASGLSPRISIVTLASRRLIRFGERHKQNLAPELAGVPVYLVPHHDGFDGQYYAHMALHPPWIYHDLINHYDFPAYRIRRDVFARTGLGLGIGPAVLDRPHIFSCFNVLAWLALARLLTVWLATWRNWVNFGRWTGCLLAAGVLGKSPRLV